MGFYQVVRSIGFSAGSALVASILASHEIAGSAFPAQSGYITALWVGAVASLVAAVVAVILAPGDATRSAGPPTPPRRSSARSPATTPSWRAPA